MWCKLLFIAFAFIITTPANALDFQTLTDDGKEYFAAPINWQKEQWRLFAVSTLTIGGAMALDNKVRDHYILNQDAEGGTRDLTKLGNAWGEIPLAGAFTLGWYALGKFRKNEVQLQTSENMFEAAIFSAIAAHGIKFAVGRARPQESDDEANWFNSGGDSFPSGHTTFAFAVSTAFAESVPDPTIWRRLFAYGLASSTAYARMHDNMHWLSDTVAGAALGVATGFFVVGKHQKQDTDWNVSVHPQMGGGIVIGLHNLF